LYKWQKGQPDSVVTRKGFWPIGTGVEFTEDGQTLRLFTNRMTTINNRVFEFDIKNGDLKDIIPNPYVLKDMKDEYPQSLALSPDRSLMAVVYNPYADKAIRLFDNVTGKFIRKIPSKIGFDTIDFMPDGKSLIGYGLPEKPVQVIDLNTGKVLKKFQVAGEITDGVVEMRLSGDKSTMVLAGYGGQLKLYNTDTFELIQSLDDSVKAFSYAISYDGSRIAILTDDGKLKLWDIPSNTLLPEYNGELHVNFYNSFIPPHLAFSPDNKQLALSTMDGLIRVFDIAP
jgi:WD40 repeat protein